MLTNKLFELMEAECTDLIKMKKDRFNMMVTLEVGSDILEHSFNRKQESIYKVVGNRHKFVVTYNGEMYKGLIKCLHSNNSNEGFNEYKSLKWNIANFITEKRFDKFEKFEKIEF